MERGDLVQELATLLVEDPEISSREWDQLAIVAQVSKESTDVSGFAYQRDGEAIATGPENFSFLDKVEQLQRVMQEPGEKSWKAILIKVNALSGAFKVYFEYDNPEKWRITGENVKQMAESLRIIEP